MKGEWVCCPAVARSVYPKDVEYIKDPRELLTCEEFVFLERLLGTNAVPASPEDDKTFVNSTGVKLKKSAFEECLETSDEDVRGMYSWLEFWSDPELVR